MTKSNPKEFLSENVKSKFRKIKKKLQLKKKNLSLKSLITMFFLTKRNLYFIFPLK